jgi:hypothetical protein
MISNADDVRLMSPSQREDVHNNNSTPTASNPLEGKTTAVVAVMRGNPKDGYTRLRSNKHCKQRMVWVLFDSGSDGDLIFVNKEKPIMLPYSKRPINATPSELASDSDIVSNWKIASDQDIAHSVTLGNPAILCNSAMLSNPATLSDPTIVCDLARLSDPATPSNPATFSNP